MPPGRKRRSRQPVAWGAALALLIASGVAVAWRHVPDPPPPGRLVSLRSRPAALLGGARIAVLRTSLGRELLEDGEPERRAERWAQIVSGAGHRPEMVADEALEAGLLQADAVVLPASSVLSAKGRAALEQFVAAGGGVVATWATGTRDARGAWTGWDFVAGLIGAAALDLDQRSPPWFVAFDARRPLGAGAAGGTRVQIASPHRAVAAAFGFGAYWSDNRLFPADEHRSPAVQGAAILAGHGKGRVAWLGFHEDAAVGDTAERAALEDALACAATWAAQRPIAAVDRWPWPAEAASAVAVHATGSLEDAARFARDVSRAGGRPTLFADRELGASDPQSLSRLAAAGEVAEAGCVVAPPNGLVDRGREALRARAWARATGTGPRGCRADAPIDESAAAALAVRGLRYALGGWPARGVLPSVASGPAGQVVSLPAVADDDLHLSSHGFAGLEPAWVERRILSDSALLHGVGGMYVLRAHAHALAAPAYAAVAPALVARWRAQKVWVAPLEDIAAWWAAREAVQVVLEAPTADALRVTIRGRTPLPAAVSVFLPSAWTQVEVLPAASDTHWDAELRKLRVATAPDQGAGTRVFELRRR